MRGRLAILTAALVFALSPPAQGQPAGKTARLRLLDDFLTGGLPPARVRALREGLRDLGWIEGRNLVIESRYAERPEQRREIAAEMERLKVDVIVACSPCAFFAAPSGGAPIRGIPLVFVAVSDPVAAGMVATLARPGGMMTGLSYQGIELNTKRLQLLKETLPEVTRVGVLVQKEHPLRDLMVKDVQGVAAPLRLTLQFFEVSNNDSSAALDTAFQSMAKDRVEAVLVLQGPQLLRERSQLAALGLKYRLPGFFDWGAYADAGGFMAYAASLDDLWRRAAGYVDRILKGATPASLPVEQPTRFEMVINQKTAKALGLSIPPSILLRADRIVDQ